MRDWSISTNHSDEPNTGQRNCLGIFCPQAPGGAQWGRSGRDLLIKPDQKAPGVLLRPSLSEDHCVSFSPLASAVLELAGVNSRPRASLHHTAAPAPPSVVTQQLLKVRWLLFNRSFFSWGYLTHNCSVCTRRKNNEIRINKINKRKQKSYGSSDDFWFSKEFYFLSKTIYGCIWFFGFKKLFLCYIFGSSK